MYLIFNRINGYVGVQNGTAIVNTDSQWSKQEACFARAYQVCGSLSITTLVSHLANEFDVRSELHGQVSLATVNQILCRSWGDSLKACSENVNISI